MLTIRLAQARPDTALRLLGRPVPCEANCRYLTKSPYLAPPTMVYYCQACGRRYVFDLWDRRERVPDFVQVERNVLPFRAPA